MANMKNLAATFVGMAAKAPPAQRPRILRNAAARFAAAASDPRNKKHAPHLTTIGLEFAGAAMRAETAALQQQTTDDFTQLLRDTHAAWEQLGPDAEFSTHAALEAQASLRDVRPNMDPGRAPSMSIAPASFDNTDVTLGRSVTVTFAPTAEQTTQGILQSQTAAFWQGIKREAQAMSVDIGTVLLPLPTPHNHTADARPYALLQYGSDGNTTNQVAVDVGLGRRINVIGNYISVNVGMDPPATGVPSAVMTLGASIAAFASPSQAPVTRTVYLDRLINGAASDFQLVPQRATTLLVPTVGTMFGAFYAGTIDVSWFDITGGPITSWRFDYGAGTRLVPVQVPADAYVFNVVASLDCKARFPFLLSL